MLDLVDCEIKNQQIRVQKICFFGWMIVIGILLVFAFFYPIMMSFVLILAPVDILFLFYWIGGRNTYGNSISVADGIITIYNYKKNKLREFELNSMEKTYLQITFPWRPSPKYTSKKCLILYKNFEPYENMEYGSYWNDPNVIIIQNPLLIEKINSLFND